MTPMMAITTNSSTSVKPRSVYDRLIITISPNGYKRIIFAQGDFNTKLKSITSRRISFGLFLHICHYLWV